MTGERTAHEKARQALEALALDVLDVKDQAGVLTHLASCASCRNELAALQATAAQLSYAVRPVQMSDSQRDRVRALLLDRAAADDAPTPDGRTVPEPHPTPSFHILFPHTPAEETLPHKNAKTATTWVAVAACIVALVSAVTLVRVRRERDTFFTAYQIALARNALVDSLRVSLEERNRLVVNLTGSHVAVINLVSNSVASLSARMFWDQSANVWTFVAHNVPAHKTGRTYQLWLVTAKSKISAGTFAPGLNGDAIARATYALPKSALIAVAVTDEPAQGSAQPTSIPILVGVNSTR